MSSRLGLRDRPGPWGNQLPTMGPAVCPHLSAIDARFRSSSFEISASSTRRRTAHESAVRSVPREQAGWLEVDRENFAVTFKNPPAREELNEPMIREQYVVEYYSR